MPTLRIVIDPEAERGIGEPFKSALEQGKLVHLTNEIVVSGLDDGMSSGKPSIAFGFVLPDGTAVIAETSWALFASAYTAFAARFGHPA